MITTPIKILAAGFIAFAAMTAPSLAGTPSVFDTLADTAPRSLFDQIADTAPRSIFDEIKDSAPRSTGAPATSGDTKP